MLTLVTFDIKGAYNWVAKNVLLHRMRERRVPELLVKWIDAFCSDREAAILVNGLLSERVKLNQAGLPQGSPLSPASFLFFNANLLQRSRQGEQGSMAFVDDYTAWVVGRSAEENTEYIQRHIIPKIERWETDSGATFDTEKTQLIHFVHRTSIPVTEIIFKGQEIKSAETAKLLGIILDSKLSWNQHVAHATTKGKTAALALKRLKGLRPQTARQLFLATGAPTMDYGSPIWFPKLTKRQREKLQQTQAIGTRAVVGAFRTVSASIADVEAGVKPVDVRLYSHARQFWVNSHTLPPKHPFWELRRGIGLGHGRHKTPLHVLNEWFDTVRADKLETIHPFCIPPWASGAEVSIDPAEEALRKAIENETGSATTAIFTDGSTRGDNSGIGAALGDGQPLSSETIQRCHHHRAEIKAIARAVKACELVGTKSRHRQQSFNISDSQSALKVFASVKSNQVDREGRSQSAAFLGSWIRRSRRQ